MDSFNSNEVSGNKISQAKMQNVSSPMKQNEKSINSVFESSKADSGVTPVKLEDFFSLLDDKTVKKIKETPSDSLDRINNDVVQMEYDAEGAKSILNSLG